MNLKIKTLSYTKSTTKDLGNFNSVRVQYSAEIEVDDSIDLEDQQKALKIYVDSLLNEEINRYEEKPTVEYKSAKKSKPVERPRENNVKSTPKSYGIFKDRDDGELYYISWNAATEQWYGRKVKGSGYISLEKDPDDDVWFKVDR